MKKEIHLTHSNDTYTDETLVTPSVMFSKHTRLAHLYKGIQSFAAVTIKCKGVTRVSQGVFQKNIIS